MRRLVVMLATATLLTAGGCGLNSYERRLTETLDRMKYENRLNTMLMPAQTKGKWEELGIYLRPPKNLELAKEFLLPSPEPGKFDLEASFYEPQKGQGAAPKQINLHVLARIKRPKGTAKKKQQPTPADTADRTNFNRDIINLLNTAYSPPDEITESKFKSKTEKSPISSYANEYKEAMFAVGDKNVHVYIQKKDIYETAMIYEYAKSEHTALVSKIQLSLECFAVGERAKRAFSGTMSEEEGGGAPQGGVAF